MTLLDQLGQPAEDVKKADVDDLVLWSVTTIIGVLDKPALLYWAAEQTAEAAISSQATWRAMLDERGHEEAVLWLRDARFRKSAGTLSATGLGSVVHAMCEEYALTGAEPTLEWIEHAVRVEAGPKMAPLAATEAAYEAQTYLPPFSAWLERFAPAYQATEVTVYSPTYSYAGTADSFLTIDGVRFIADLKTSRKSFDRQGKATTPYPEQVGLQLAAYRYAEMAAVWRPRRTEQFRRRYYLLGPAEQQAAVPVPEVDHGLVIHLTPEHCDAFPIECGPDVHRAFLYAQECSRWVNQTSRTVMGQPLQKGA